MRKILFYLSLLLPVAAQAQRGGQGFTQQFNRATVLLTTGDTLVGPVLLHQTEETLLMEMPDHAIRTLAAVSVQAFIVQSERYDQDDFYAVRQDNYHMPSSQVLALRHGRPDTAFTRVFRTYRWNRGNDYSDFRAPAFFEQLSGSPVRLLRRQGLVQRHINAGMGPYVGDDYYGNRTRTMGYYTDVKDTFYLGLPNGNVISLRNPKKDLLAYFHRHSRQLEQYAKDNKLSYTDARELAYLVNYANSLSAGKE